MYKHFSSTGVAAAAPSAAMEAVNHSKNSAMEAYTISKHGTGLRSHRSRGNLLFVILMLFSLTGSSLFGQVSNRNEVSTEMLSNVSTIVECDATMLGYIFSTGLEPISNYLKTYTNLNQIYMLIDYFSECGKNMGGSNPVHHDKNPNTYQSFLKLGMTHEELGEIIVKHVGFRNFMPDHTKGFCSRRNAEKISSILQQELEDYWEPEYVKAEKAIEENMKIIELIPPDYRYPLAISTMHGFVRNFRASTWKECADLYAQQLNYWIVEANSREFRQLFDEVNKVEIASKPNNFQFAGKVLRTAFPIFLGFAGTMQSMINEGGRDIGRSYNNSQIRYRDPATGNIYDEDGNRVPW